MNNRRQFLSATLGGSAVVAFSPSVPDFLLQAAAPGTAPANERILVVVQLSGGNDGLNTVVPYEDDAYYQNRFTLAVDKNQVHKIDDYVGFHPAMNEMGRLSKDGKLTVIQGVGYPNPNRSHFESMDLWHTAHRKSRQIDQGWLGRSLQQLPKPSGERHAMALHLGQEQLPLALASQSEQVPSLRSLQRFRLASSQNAALSEAIQANTEVARPDANSMLKFVQQNTKTALATSRRIERILGQYDTPIDYPATSLAGKLRSVAQLIHSQLPARIYYVTLDGFDTHANQIEAHASLLAELSGAVNAFVRDLAHQGQQDRVLVMSFSEFGRRVRENASRGTDHGAAAPVLLAGNQLKSTLLGKHPSLTDLDDGDLKFSIDYRRVYASVLQDWLGLDSRAILGKSFRPLPLFT